MEYNRPFNFVLYPILETMKEYKVKEQKVIHSLLYICKQLGGEWDMYAILKILYFAEVEHLTKYGRPITGDTMVSFEHGPAPSKAYDEVKHNFFNPNFKRKDNVVSAKKEPNLKFLSQSDIECLDKSISENSVLSFGKLREKSHDSAYNKTRGQNNNTSTPISFIDIAQSYGANQHLVEYISEQIALNKSF